MEHERIRAEALAGIDRTDRKLTTTQREAGRRLSLRSRWAGEVSIPIVPVKSGELYRLSYRPVRRSLFRQLVPPAPSSGRMTRRVTHGPSTDELPDGRHRTRTPTTQSSVRPIQ
jgi:hypothetical protein